jgi:hypothetical protein
MLPQIIQVAMIWVRRSERNPTISALAHNKLLEDRARERGVLDEWEGELEKLARKKGPSSLPVEVLKKLPDREDIEKKATEIMSKFLGIPLTKQRLETCGKLKGFDLVNVEQGIVGDVKDFGHKGDSPLGANGSSKAVCLSLVLPDDPPHAPILS